MIISENKNRGITLIALVITIIVLLILAGVTISMLSGENGILTKASDASEETKNKTIEEQINLGITDAKLQSKDYMTIESAEELQNALTRQGLKATVTGNATDGYVVKVENKSFEISSTGKKMDIVEGLAENRAMGI